MCLRTVMDSVYTMAWLHAQGCPWDVGVTYRTAARGCLDMLIWLVDHGCTWDKCGC